MEGAEHELFRDERALWQRADESDSRLRESGALYRDDALEAYLMSLGRELIAGMGAPDAPFRIHAVSDPLLNAFAQPNGSIYLNTGMIARAESETELALVIAHELSHYLRRHTLKEHRSARNRHTRAVVGSVVMAVLVGVVIDPGSYAEHLARVQTSGYSRDLEREADFDAFDALRSTGRDVAAIPRIFEQMIEEAEELDQPFYHGSHPRLTERVEYARAYLAEAGIERLPDAHSVRSIRTAYDRQIAPALLAHARLSFESGYRRKAIRSVGRHLDVRPDSLDAHLLRARLARSRLAEPEEQRTAIAAYREAIRIDPDHASAHRELGLLLRSMQGNGGEAPALLRRYLALEPDAPDRAVIEGLFVLRSEPSSSLTLEGAAE